MDPLPIQELPSDQCEERPPGTVIDTLIIHSMYNPDAPDCFAAAAGKALLDHFGVSAHYLIDRAGVIWRTVSEEKKAWHAGESKMPDPADGRSRVNEFSIGVELLGSEDSGFTDAQYHFLVQLSVEILLRHPIRSIYGHADIAPERKTDPWCFDWPRYRRAVLGCGARDLKFSPAALIK